MPDSQLAGNAHGAHVPPRGVLYIHDEVMGWDSVPEGVEDFLKVQWVGVSGVEWAGVRGPSIHVTRVGTSIASIEYEGPAGSGLRVFDRDDVLRAEYVLDADWQAPKQAPRVVQSRRNQHQWTCSWSDSLMLELDQPMAAVRMRWLTHGGEVDYIEALQGETLELGKINCGGENMPLDQLIAGGVIELFAIRLDGSEVPIIGLPRWIALGDFEPESRGGGNVLLVLAALGLLGAVWLIRRVEKSGSDCLPAS